MSEIIGRPNLRPSWQQFTTEFDRDLVEQAKILIPELTKARECGHKVIRLYMADPGCPASGFSTFEITNLEESPPREVDPRSIWLPRPKHVLIVALELRNEPTEPHDYQRIADVTGVPVEIYMNSWKLDPLDYGGRFSPNSL